MFNRSHTIEIHCDAPPYSIVQACRMIGMANPEDVRWERLGHYRTVQPGRLELFNPLTWKVFFGIGELKEMGCTCGRDLPRLEKYTFTLITAVEVHYLLGQCPRCHTIFWEEA